jgi:predicted transcriptional regulator
VTRDGSYLDGKKLSDLSIDDLHVTGMPYITVRIGIAKDAENEGGLNLFGRKFGNYEIDLEMRLDVVSADSR